MSTFKRYVTSRATQQLCHHLGNHDFETAATFFEIPLPIYVGDDRIIASNGKQLRALLYTF